MWWSSPSETNAPHRFAVSRQQHDRRSRAHRQLGFGRTVQSLQRRLLLGRQCKPMQNSVSRTGRPHIRNCCETASPRQKGKIIFEALAKLSEVRAPIRIRTASDSVLIPGKRGFARGSFAKDFAAPAAEPKCYRSHLLRHHGKPRVQWSALSGAANLRGGAGFAKIQKERRYHEPWDGQSRHEHGARHYPGNAA
jgi:hypothetical protein